MCNDVNFPTQLIDTIDLMTSEDYKDRFCAEYYQLKIRRDKLQDLMERWSRGLLNFQPTCDYTTYEKQIKYMDKYLEILIRRAQKENVSVVI